MPKGILKASSLAHLVPSNALKLLERNDFDYDLVEDLTGYVVQLPKSSKYAQILNRIPWL
jgi:hypothetical protein